MTIEQAIQKANDNGYPAENTFVSMNGSCFIVRAKHPNGLVIFEGSINDVLLDPLFWQALGKSMGWVEIQDVEERLNQVTQEMYKIHVVNGDSWKYHWHKLIDHLAEGGSIEEYFEKL